MDFHAARARLFQACALTLSLLAANAFAGTEPAGSMAAARSNHVAVALPDGRALVAGGYAPSSGTATATAEVFDVFTGTFSAAPAMAGGRALAAGVLLGDGRALVIGGTTANQSPPINLATAEIYDPATNTWSAAGAMVVGRQAAAAVLLADGRVLVIGGDTTMAAAEIYDPATNSFAATGSLATPRIRFAASALADGRVLVAGGTDSNFVPKSSAEIWDPSTGLWSSAGTMTSARGSATATRLADGRVLIAGGLATSSWSSAVAAAEIFDPATGTFSATGSIATTRHAHVAARLGTGDVVIAGGISSGSTITGVLERYDVATGTWAPGGALSSERQNLAAIALSNGEVLVAGGYSYAGTVATAELVDAACIATLASVSPASVNYNQEAQSGSVEVTHAAGCAWRVSQIPSWMTVTSTVPGYGTGSFTYTLAANTTTFGRGQTVKIGDATFQVNQSAHPCVNATVSPSSQTLPYTGGSNSVGVSAGSGCTWTVAGVPAWMTITPSSGSGSATLSFTLASNAGAARSATLSVATRSFTVNQNGSPCGTGPTISPASRSLGFAAGSSSVTVTANSGCAWTVSGAPSWITIASSGSGSTTLNFSVASNAGGAERTSTFTVAGNAFTVTQAADLCTGATLSVSGLALPNTASSGTVDLTAPAACAWTIANAPAWLTFPSGTSGTGSATISYNAAANADTGATRSATISIAAIPLSVVQAAGNCAGTTVTPATSPTIAAGGGSGSVTVNAPASCTWSIAGAPAWVTVTTPMPVTGSTTVSYTVAANTGTARNAALTASGATHTVAQAGTVSYCPTRGNITSYEWIAQIAIGGTSRITGRDGGYADFTGTTPINLSRNMTLALSPGFSSGSYTEYWKIWIDYNRDGTFSESEVLYSGSNSGPIGTTVTIPTWVTPGASTRMRVTMKYGGTPGPCEIFTYGEVEDYTVILP